MSSILSSPSFIGTVITIVAGVLVTLIGLVYRRMKRRIDGHDDTLEALDSRTSTLWHWAFGNEANDADRGISQDIEENFDSITEQLNSVEEKHDQQHEEVTSKLDQLVSELHHEEAVDIDREDLE